MSCRKSDSTPATGSTPAWYFGDNSLAQEQTSQSEVAAGAPDKIRTCDLCLRRAALYPAELRARVAIFIAEPGRYGNAAKPGGTRKWSATAPRELCRVS